MLPLTRRLTATMLAAIFAVVGATGESLYYLVEAQPEQTSQREDHHHSGLLHHHGDELWHHHGALQSESFTSTTTEDDQPKICDQHGTIHSLSWAHQNHSCLALSLVSEIEHSIANSATFHALPDCIAPDINSQKHLALASFRSTIQPRGPPAQEII